MALDLTAIPEERLALLDIVTLYHGSHDGTGGPDCKHCARELLHEIVTGEHKDRTPPGCTRLMAILPRLNDGPWRDDEHRTTVMRPYLRRMLALDPAQDQLRIFAIIDHVYRTALPAVCDALKLTSHGSSLRDLPPIMDRQSARNASKIWRHGTYEAVKKAAFAYAAYAAAYAYAAAAADAAYAAYAAADADDDDADAYAAAAADDAYAAADDAAAADAAAAAAADKFRAIYADNWGRGVQAVLDRICAIP